MQLDIIGASPAWPNPDEAHAGYLVTGHDGRRILLDCGPGVLSRLRGRDLLPVNAIAITHLHLDHWGDLVPWCWLHRGLAEHRGDKPELWLPPGGRAALATYGELFGRAPMFDDAFAASEYSPWGYFETTGVRVQAIPVAHFGAASFGFRVVGDATLGYSGDTAPCEALHDIAREADLFLCESTLAEPSEDANPRGHMTAAEAREAAGSTRLLLTHRPRELGPTDIAPVATGGMRISL